MFGPTAHAAVAALLAVLVATAFVNLGSLALEFERPAFDALSAAMGGSGTAAIALLAAASFGAALAAPALGAILRRRRSLISGAATPPANALSDGTRLLGMLETLYPDRGFGGLVLVRAGRGQAPWVHGQLLALPSAMAEILRRGRARDPLAFDVVCLQLLHEAAHRQTADLHWLPLRRGLVRLLAALLGVILGLNVALGWAGVWLPVMQFVAIVPLGVAVLTTTLQISREVEQDMDRIALAALADAHGRAAAEAAAQRLAEALSAASADTGVVIDGTGHHPGRGARIAALQGRRRFGGLVMLWSTALAALVVVQSLRIAPDCGDCRHALPAVYDVAAGIAMMLLTGLVLMVERRRGRFGAVSRGGRFAGLCAAAAVYGAARVVAVGEMLPAWVEAHGAIEGPLRMVLVGGDAYVAMIALHFLLVAIAFAFMPVRPDGPGVTLLGSGFAAPVRPGRDLAEAALRLHARAWRVFDLSLGTLFIAASVLLALHVGFRNETEQDVTGVPMALGVGLFFLAVGTRPKPLLLVLEGIVLSIVLLILGVLLVALAALVAAHGLDLADPATQVQVGDLLSRRPSALLAGFPATGAQVAAAALALVVVVATALWLRWRGERLEPAET